jgi:hypothetical protein
LRAAVQARQRHFYPNRFKLKLLNICQTACFVFDDKLFENTG